MRSMHSERLLGISVLHGTTGTCCAAVDTEDGSGRDGHFNVAAAVQRVEDYSEPVAVAVAGAVEDCLIVFLRSQCSDRRQRQQSCLHYVILHSPIVSFDQHLLMAQSLHGTGIGRQLLCTAFRMVPDKQLFVALATKQCRQMLATSHGLCIEVGLKAHRCNIQLLRLVPCAALLACFGCHACTDLRTALLLTCMQRKQNLIGPLRSCSRSRTAKVANGDLADRVCDVTAGVRGG